MFSKNIIVGVSVSPETGLEIAQVDYLTGTVLKYGRKTVDYNIVKREIADLDLFKETLQDLLEEMDIQKGTELVLNLPTVAMKVTDYPAALEETQVESAIEEELYENPYLKNFDPAYSSAVVNSSLQFKKVAYTALNKSMLIELLMSIKEMGYKIRTVDTSINSILRSLIYTDRVNTEPDTSWVLMVVDNSTCRIMQMLGRNYVDYYEEKISIGEVLSDAENYATVISAADPILRNLPSKYLCIVSRTNVISAEVLANKISYSAPITYQEANCYLKEPLLKLSNLVEEEYTKSITLEVIGAAIYPDFAKTSYINFNLFNKTLGDIYLMEQPPTIMGGTVVLTNPLLAVVFFVIAAVLIFILISTLGWFAVQNNGMRQNINDMNREIESINSYIERHKDISAETFDEGDEIRIGVQHNKNVYSYYTIVGTEIPQKLWLTYLKLGEKTTIEGQADNLESVYAFFRSLKDYNPGSDLVLQRLGLATKGAREINDISSDSVLTSLDADFYQFRISNEPEKSSGKGGSKANNLPELEVIN